jgi:F-type H+-transporting ATPase subunit delta
MNDSKISVRYSRALFELALEKNVIDDVYNDMIWISEVSSTPEVKDLLNSPVIPPSKKQSVLRAVFSKNVNKLSMSLIDMVVLNGREKYIPAIARVFKHETMKYKGITEVILTTAVKVDENIKDQISGLVAESFGTKVDLKEVVDSEIIGGFILRIDDNYLDASIRNKLHKIEKELKAGI